MNFNFDYKSFEKAAQENLAKVFAESIIDQENIDPQYVNDAYCKIRKILDCPEMEKCYPFLYSLDIEHINEEDMTKVNKLYECGIQRGVITEDGEENETVSDGLLEDDDDHDEDDFEISSPDDCEDGKLCGGPDDMITPTDTLDTVPQKPVDFDKPTYTVLYSATKDGEVKLGEFYSNGKTTLDAREDCDFQLKEAGYSSIEILAIERSRYGSDSEAQVVPYDEYDVYGEDDSEEYEKQETGDTSSDSEGDDVADEKQDNGNESTEEQSDTENTDGSEDEENGEEDGGEGEEENGEDEEPSSGENSEKENKDETPSSDEESDEKETADTDDSEDNEDKKLTADEKNALKEEYTKIFKDVLKKQKLEKSVEEMDLEERVGFWKAISDKWTKNDPSEFLSDKEQEKLNKIVVKSDDVDAEEEEK